MKVGMQVFSTTVITTSSRHQRSVADGMARSGGATRRLLQAVCLCLGMVLSHAVAGEAADTVPLFTNLGTLHHPITTTSERAQQYFDQGLRLVYAFNHEEEIGRAHV